MPRRISIIIGAGVGFVFGTVGGVMGAWGGEAGFFWNLYRFVAAPMVRLMAVLVERFGLEAGCIGFVGYLVYFMTVGAVVVVVGNWGLMTGVEKLADIIKERNGGEAGKENNTDFFEGSADEEKCDD